MIDDKYLNTARAVSLTSPHTKVKIGACIVKSHTVVSASSNLLKSHPMQKLYNRLRPIAKLRDNLHAEMAAIIKAEKVIDNFNNTTLYVYRENKFGNLAMCKPCQACMAKIKEIGIRRIVYTSPEGINTLDLKDTEYNAE